MSQSDTIMQLIERLREKTDKQARDLAVKATGPDKSRGEKEKAYGRLMAKLLKAYGGRLLEKLGDPPSLDNLPADFWDEEARDMTRALTPFGERVFLDAAEQLLKATPAGVDWAIVNQRAIDWAASYSFELVRGINETTREAISRAISDYFEQGLTRGELEERLRPSFSPVRAEMIAVTEITRASSEGERAIAEELSKQGIEMIPIWQTNDDEFVCPLCGPKDGKEIKDGAFPPEHPNCRCFVSYELLKVD